MVVSSTSLLAPAVANHGVPFFVAGLVMMFVRTSWRRWNLNLRVWGGWGWFWYQVIVMAWAQGSFVGMYALGEGLAQFWYGPQWADGIVFPGGAWGNVRAWALYPVVIGISILYLSACQLGILTPLRGWLGAFEGEKQRNNESWVRGVLRQLWGRAFGNGGERAICCGRVVGGVLGLLGVGAVGWLAWAVAFGLAVIMFDVVVAERWCQELTLKDWRLVFLWGVFSTLAVVATLFWVVFGVVPIYGWLGIRIEDRRGWIRRLVEGLDGLWMKVFEEPRIPSGRVEADKVEGD